MIRRAVVLALALVLTGIATTTLLRSQGVSRLQPYEADLYVTYTTADGKSFASQGKTYRSADGSLREDTLSGATIINKRTHVHATLNKGTKEAYVRELPKSRPGRTQVERPVTTLGERRVVMGRTVREHVVEVRPGITQKIRTDEEGEVVTYMQLVSPGMTVTKTLLNVKIGPIPGSMFQVPPEYKVISAPELDDVPADPSSGDLFQWSSGAKSNKQPVQKQ